MTEQDLRFNSRITSSASSGIFLHGSLQWRAGRVWGPQLEIRRNMGPGKITTGVLNGEALGTGWLSS